MQSVYEKCDAAKTVSADSQFAWTGTRMVFVVVFSHARVTVHFKDSGGVTSGIHSTGQFDVSSLAQGDSSHTLELFQKGKVRCCQSVVYYERM